MKKLLLTLTALLIFFPFLNTRAAEPNISYYEIRYQIACQNYDTTDARCFWNKVEFIHAKEILDRSDVMDYLTSKEIERITKKLRFLESRYENFCEEAEEPSYFCSALGKLVEKGQYFVDNGQAYSNEGSASVITEVEIEENELHESASSTYECSSDTYNCSDFSLQSEAQTAHDYCMSQVGSDIHKLDLDNDGSACESL